MILGTLAGAAAAAAGITELRPGGSSTDRALLARAVQLDAGLSAQVTVDLWQPTGKSVQPYMYGYATGDLADNDFLLATNATVQSSAETLAPPLLRFNTSESTIIQSVFANGVANPDWTPFSRWQQYGADFLGSDGRLVFGIGPNNANTSLSPATWAAYASATAVHFQSIGHEVTYWEVGNECDKMGVELYARYFNAIADALHSVNPNYLVGGPVSSYWNGIDLRSFVGLSGSRLGFIDFHSYSVMDGYTLQTAYERAAHSPDVASARSAVAGTVAADLPIGLLEYNMNGSKQPDGTYGSPAQGTITGAVYIALLLTQSFETDQNFTMGGLWDLVTDSYYGAIGNQANNGDLGSIDEQGWYLRQAAQLMPGQQVSVTQSGSDLQALATVSELEFSLQLVNYSVDQAQLVETTVIGSQLGLPLRRWELSPAYPAGNVSIVLDLGQVPVPAQGIVILTGVRQLLSI